MFFNISFFIFLCFNDKNPKTNWFEYELSITPERVNPVPTETHTVSKSLSYGVKISWHPLIASVHLPPSPIIFISELEFIIFFDVIPCWYNRYSSLETKYKSILFFLQNDNVGFNKYLVKEV